MRLFQILGLTIIVMVFLAGCLSGDKELITDESSLQAEFLKAYGTINCYSAEFTQSYLPSSGSAQETFSFSCKPESKSRVDFISSNKYGNGSYFVSDGNNLLIYYSGEDIYEISELKNGRNPVLIYDWQKISAELISDGNFRITGNYSVNGDLYYIIESDLPQENRYTDYLSTKIVCHVDPWSGKTWKVLTYWNSDIPNKDVEYKEININCDLPDELFSLIPPVDASPRCIPKYADYSEPEKRDTSYPVSQNMPEVKYSFDINNSGEEVFIEEGDIIEISLPYIPTLIYQWLMPVEPDIGFVLLNAGGFSDLSEEEISKYGGKGPGIYRWRYQAEEKGVYYFDGVFSLDGCDVGDSTKKFNLTVAVR